VCLLPVDVCDGYEQCPQGDDEWLCGDTSCPEGCVCQGLAFLCDQPFSSASFPPLRYLNVQNAPFNVSLLPQEAQAYLVYLNVNNGSGDILPRVLFPNLLIANLYGNNLEAIDISCLFMMPNLKALRLSNNPLTQIFNADVKGTRNLPLKVLDLGITKVETFDSTQFSILSHLEELRLAQSSLRFIGKGGFKEFNQLKYLDVSETLLDDVRVSIDVFDGLTQLGVVLSPNYRLCCADLFSTVHVKPRCFSNDNTLSSCDNLLRSSTHHAVLITLGVLAVAGNAACVFMRHVVYGEFSASFSFPLLMTNVNVAYFVTGCYCCLLVGAHEWFRSTYFHHEFAWRNSALCQTAGVLLVLSKKVATLLVTLITLDRLLSVHCSSWTSRFGRRSAVLTSVAAWCVGIALAGVPLIPFQTSWDFYSRSGLCLPLPCHFSHYGGHYHFALEAVLPSVLTILVACCQTLLIKRIPTFEVAAQPNTSDTENDFSRTFMKLAMCDCVGGAILSFTSLVTYLANVKVEEDVAAALAVFMLPFSAALNPCLYMISRIMEDRRRETQRRLLIMLKRQHVQRKR
jgi:hypothetical protein